MTMFDDADWHAGGEFPAELPASAAATHIGMFLAWCAAAGLVRDEGLTDHLAALHARMLTPGAFALIAADGVLSADLLSEEGAAFAGAYYGLPEEEHEGASFDDDYVDVFLDDGETIYHVPDSWGSFDRVAPVLDLRYAQWRGRPVS